jgi:predicted nucleic acid-binding protein
MVVVADTSPLTALLHLGQLPILRGLYGRIVVPASVVQELNSLPAFGYDISFIKDEEQFLILTASNIAMVQSFSVFLDAGEAEAIALAKELSADLLLIDERLGREVAEKIQIQCKGVVGVLIEAKNAGLITLVKPLLDRLIEELKFRLSDHIYSLALQKAGELK